MEHSKDVPAGEARSEALPSDQESSAMRIPTEAHRVPLIVLTVLAVIFILDWAQTVLIPLVLGWS
jgi:hypothetical protein